MKRKKNLLSALALSTVIILTLVLVSGIAMGGRAVASTSDLSTAVISAVQSGTTSTSTITLGSSSNPIGTTVNIDIRIDHVSTGFWGWATPTVTWNPAVLNLTKVQKGSFLSDNTGAETTDLNGDSSSLFDNFHGVIQGGLAEGILGTAISTDSSGVLATLTFLVTGSGSSTIGIAGGYLIPDSSSISNSVDVTCNNATVSVLSYVSTPTIAPTSTSVSTSAPTSTSTTNPSLSLTQSPTASPVVSVPEFSLGIVIPVLIIVTTILVVPAFLSKKKSARTRNPLRNL